MKKDKNMKMLSWLILVLCLENIQVYCIDNGVGLTPPMGWNSWNHFQCNVSEKLIIKTADTLIKTGLAAKGYKYVNIDDCWQIGRNETTHQLIPDPQRFPNGIEYLSQYLHGKGLLLGIYSDAGEKTCEGRPGSYGFEEIDAKTFAKWGIDYLKYDNCYSNVGISTIHRYYKMAKALNDTNHKIYYSICNWGQEEPWNWAPDMANSWRTTEDIKDDWRSFTSIMDRQNGLEVYAGKGGWNDPDMLEIGNGNMTQNEYQAHFVMWAILKAPLLLGCNLETLTPTLLNIISNQQVIAVNQDELGVQAKRYIKLITNSGTGEIWAGPLADDKWIVVFLNLSQVPIKSLQIEVQSMIGKRFKHYDIKNILDHKDQGRSSEAFIEDDVDPRSVTAYVLSFDKADNTKSTRTLNLQSNNARI